MSWFIYICLGFLYMPWVIFSFFFVLSYFCICREFFIFVVSSLYLSLVIFIFAASYFYICRELFFYLLQVIFRCASISWIHVGEWVIDSCFWDFIKSWAFLQGMFSVCSGYVQSVFRVCSECVQSVFRVCSECVQYWSHFIIQRI